MDTAATRPVSSAERISLRELTGLLWKRRWVIILGTVVVTGTVAVLSFILPKRYTATVVIAPVSQNSSALGGSGMAAMLSQVGGLASLAGLSLPGGDEKSENVAILQSEELAQRFLAANNLVPVLERQDRKLDSLWKADVYFREKIMQVTTDTKTGLVSLKVNWTDPSVAAQWANGMVKLTNNYIRNKAIAETQRNIEYLNEQVSRTDAIGIRQAIYSIMQDEIKKQMLAKGSDEYALKIIDPAFAPERQTSPRPLFWTVGAFLGCIVTSVLAALCWLAWRDL